MTDDQNSSTDNSDMDTESDADDNDSVFQNRLAEWASKFQISHSAIAHLISILQDSHTNLPKDPRTLLQTKRDYELRTIEGGSYYHFDMKLSISDALAAVDLPDSVRADLKIIYVQINIDGLPLFKSSNVQFWPILGRIDNPIQGEPFIIGLFCGRSKPVHVEEYLRDFITEMQALENDGFQFEGFNHQLHVKISCFICDAPATAFIKQIKGHSGYYGCGSCVQSGVWQGKITFPLVDSPLRTDVQFDEMVNEEHHIGSSPLKNLSIGMVSQFPLDYISSPFYVVSHCQYAHELLCFFVQEFGNLYGRDMLVYNVHGLVHLAEDAQRFGTLQSFSAFPFESFLGKLKKKIRKPTCPLQQIIRRLSEERHHLSHSVNLTPPSVPKREHIEGPLPFEFNNCTV